MSISVIVTSYSKWELHFHADMKMTCELLEFGEA